MFCCQAHVGSAAGCTLAGAGSPKSKPAATRPRVLRKRSFGARILSLECLRMPKDAEKFGIQMDSIPPPARLRFWRASGPPTLHRRMALGELKTLHEGAPFSRVEPNALLLPRLGARVEPCSFVRTFPLCCCNLAVFKHQNL